MPELVVLFSQGKRGLVPRALKEFVICHLPFVIRHLAGAGYAWWQNDQWPM